MKSWRARMVLLTVVAAGAAAGSSAQGVECLPNTLPDYASPRINDSDSVVVFLHGLHGDGRETWTHAPFFGIDVSWPCLVLKDAEIFGTGNVYLASYLTRAARPNPSIEDAARILAEDLRTAGVLRHRSVTFVLHSMGGIVFARLMTMGLLQPAELVRVRLAVFLATPAMPTEAARICEKFGVNRQCQQMADAQEMETLWAAWDKLPNRPALRCVAEGRDMPFLGLPPWLRIVPEESAHRACGATPWRPRDDESDHSSLVKPSGLGKMSHRQLRTMFHACVGPYRTGPRPTPAILQLTEQVTDWFHNFVEALQGDPTRSVDVMTPYITQVSRYKYPESLTSPLDSRRYQDINQPSFARALWTLQPALHQLSVRWVRPATDTVDLIPDSAFTGLLRDFERAGASHANDVLLAVGPAGGAGQTLVLRLRRQETGALGLVGLVPLPPAPATCVASDLAGGRTETTSVTHQTASARHSALP